MKKVILALVFSLTSWGSVQLPLEVSYPYQNSTTATFTVGALSGSAITLQMLVNNLEFENLITLQTVATFGSTASFTINGPTTGIANGQTVIGPSIPYGITVIAHSGTSVTLSSAPCPLCSPRTQAISFVTPTPEANIQVNGNTAISLISSNLTFDPTCIAAGGLGGGISNCTVTMSIPAGQLVASSSNTLTFNFLTTDGNTSAIRILSFNFYQSGSPLISSGQFVQFNPNQNIPPFTDGTHIAAGLAAFTAENTLTQPNSGGSGSVTIHAACSDCHSKDGSDLYYFNYSTTTLIGRSEYHGLNLLKGQEIASYILSLTSPNPSTPWNYVYQPGPGLDQGPAANWANGIGLSGVLANDAQMYPFLFPTGTPKDWDPNNFLSTHNVPIMFPLLTWNQWLPKKWPGDAYGLTNTAPTTTTTTTITAGTQNITVGSNTGFVAGAPLVVDQSNPMQENCALNSVSGGTTLNITCANPHSGTTPIAQFPGFSVSPSPFLDYTTCITNLVPNNVSNYVANSGCITNMANDQGLYLQSLGTILGSPSNWSATNASDIYSLNQWIATKNFELNHVYGLEGEAAASGLFGTGVTRAWFYPQTFRNSPSINRIQFPSAGILNGTQYAFEYESFAWYHLAMILNNGFHQLECTVPLDFNYMYGFIENMSAQFNASTFLFNALWHLEGNQVMNNGNPPGNPAGCNGYIYDPTNPDKYSNPGNSVMLTGTTLPFSTVTQIFNNELQQYANTLQGFTPTEWYTAQNNSGSPTANEIVNAQQGWFNGFMSSSGAYWIPRMQAWGVNSATIEQLINIWSGIFPGTNPNIYNWWGLQSATCTIVANSDPSCTSDITSSTGLASPTVPANFYVQIAPNNANNIIRTNTTVQFSAGPSYFAGTDVWTVTPAIGSISSGGLYTAPTSLTNTTQVTIKDTRGSNSASYVIYVQGTNIGFY